MSRWKAKMGTLEYWQEVAESITEDRDDWRKGVELIAAALKFPGPGLSCVAIANYALELRAQIEEAPHERSCTVKVNFPAGECDCWKSRLPRAGGKLCST